MQTLNQTLFLYINNFSHKNNMLDLLFIITSEYMPYLFIVFLCAIYFVFKLKNEALNSFFSVLLALSFSFIIGLFFYSNRPFVDYENLNLVTHLADNSFPSDHSTFIFAIALSLFMQLKNKIIGFLIIFFAILGAVARIYVGVHYPLDILGAFIGAFIASFIILKANIYLQVISNLIQKIEIKIYKTLHIIK
jgi:undecaprenyl-diphosphatase